MNTKSWYGKILNNEDLEVDKPSYK